jgi:Raf kinase inhibitor-like YbhB/YbcL family protein
LSFALHTTAFSNGGEIPRRYTCSGENISPALNWSGAPPRTRSLALICDDPDAPAGTWTHWLIWNLPAAVASLPEALPAQKSLDTGACQGTNDFGRIGYGGPCPPAGRPHRYFFRLFALDANLDLKPGSDRAEMESTMKPHIIGEAEWMGMFKR